MAVPRGPPQKPASKKREATRRATDGDAKKRPEQEPVRPDAASRPAATAADGVAKKREATRRANSDGDAKKRPEEEPVRPGAARPAAAAAADGQAKKKFVLAQGDDDDDDDDRAAGDRDAERLLEEPVQPEAAGPAASDREAETQFALAQEAPAAAVAATDHDAKKRSVLPQGAPAAARSAAENRPELAREAGAKQQPGPEEAAKKSPELLQANATAPSCLNSSSPDGGRAKELGAEGTKNRDAPNAAAASSNSGGLETTKLLPATASTTAGKKRGEDECQEVDPAVACAVDNKEHKKSEAEECKKHEVEIGDGDLKASTVWKFISWPWRQQLSQELSSWLEREPDFLQKNTSLLSRLFECCGLIDLTIDKDLKNLHVNEKIILISQAQDHYNIFEKSVVEKLCNFYSSFRTVLGDGECFYRSFIYAYLEIVHDNDSTSEENRLLCAIENISLACMTLHWLYGDYTKYCQAFKELLQKVKNWKTETRADRRMLLLTYFEDYKESEAILSFLRTASAAWILTHPEFAEFHPIEDGTTLEEHCRSQILQRRSYADNLAIAALAHALGVQIEIFSLGSGYIQDMCGSHSCKSNATVSLAYTGIHYDILYPRR